MAEELTPQEIGRRIAAEYLSRRGWVVEWRRTVNRQLYPGFAREELEEKQRQCDTQEQENEDHFSGQVEPLRRDGSPAARQALRQIVNMLGNRTDLGYFAKRIVDRLKQEI